MMIGLNDKSKTSSYNDINYALYADKGTVRVYESGRQIGVFGRYGDGETFQVQVNEDEEVEYLQDGHVLYTSKVPPTFPLFADVSIYNQPGQFLKVQWIQEAIKGSKPDDFVKWAGLERLTAGSDGTVVRSEGSGWNAGAYSERAITRVGDAVVGISAVAADTKAHMMIGLNDKSKTSSYSDINYALYADKGTVRVYESGRHVKALGRYRDGQTFQVLVNKDGKVEYLQEGYLLYTSTKTPTFPLWADVSIHNPGKFLRVRWIKEAIKSAMPAEPDNFIKWAGLERVTAGSDGSLVRSQGTGWNAGAYSERAITWAGDAVVGISALAADTKAHMMIGLNDKSKTSSYNDINYALYADKGTVRVYESGRQIGVFGRYGDGETFQVQVNEDEKVEYLQDGHVLYTSKVPPTFPLFADVSIYNQPGQFLKVQWIQEAIKGSKPDDFVKWAGLERLTAGSDGSVVRSEGSGWNAGAYSERAITRVGDAVVGISAVAADTKAHMMIGLNDKSKTSSYSDINYALYADK